MSYFYFQAHLVTVTQPGADGETACGGTTAIRLELPESVCNKEITPEAASLMRETNGIRPVHAVQNLSNMSIVAISILILSPGTEHTCMPFTAAPSHTIWRATQPTPIGD